MDDRAPSRDAPARAPLPDAWWSLPLRTRRIIASGVAVGVVVLIAALVSITIDGGGEQSPEAFVASLPPQRLATWDALAECESESRWDLDEGNGYFGGIQFSMGSWESVGGTGSPAAASREEQIMRGELLFELQGWGAWPKCSARLDLE